MRMGMGEVVSENECEACDELCEGRCHTCSVTSKSPKRTGFWLWVEVIFNLRTVLCWVGNELRELSEVIVFLGILNRFMS